MSEKNKTNWQKVAKYEKAIAEKYGEDTVQHPRKNWDAKDEEEYIEQVTELLKKKKKYYQKERKKEKDGYLVSNRLFKRESKRTCPVCKEYSFEIHDDFYMNKFDCCFKCYIQHVEDREERWESGWRPNKEE